MSGNDVAFREPAFYVELKPLVRHRCFVDHLFILKDHGRLSRIGRNLFASPFSEIALIGRCQQAHTGTDVGTGLGVATWRTFHLAPRFGKRPRREDFNGWIVGFRCQPLERDQANAALARLSEVFTPPDDSDASLDSLIRALDQAIEHLRPQLESAVAPAPTPAPRARNEASAKGSEPHHGNTVAAMAAMAGITPRTLQRHLRRRTGLAPKRFMAVQRLSDTLRRVALGRDSLAQVAWDAGYSDQAHLTTELSRHTGLSPGRLRATARVHRQAAQDTVRFIKDSKLRDRARLVLSDSGVTDDEAINDDFPTQRSKLRGADPRELRADGCDGNLEYRDRSRHCR